MGRRVRIVSRDNGRLNPGGSIVCPTRAAPCGPGRGGDIAGRKAGVIVYLKHSRNLREAFFTAAGEYPDGWQPGGKGKARKLNRREWNVAVRAVDGEADAYEIVGGIDMIERVVDHDAVADWHLIVSVRTWRGNSRRELDHQTAKDIGTNAQKYIRARRAYGEDAAFLRRFHDNHAVPDSEGNIGEQPADRPVFGVPVVTETPTDVKRREQEQAASRAEELDRQGIDRRTVTYQTDAWREIVRLNRQCGGDTRQLSREDAVKLGKLRELVGW